MTGPACAITFFYYPDIAAVAPFYREVMGFELVQDQGMAQIYRIAPGAYFGIVDGTKGHLRHQERSAVLLTVVDEDVEGWHARLSALGVAGLTEIRQNPHCDCFFFKDPAGYAIEVQRFRDPEVARLFARGGAGG